MDRSSRSSRLRSAGSRGALVLAVMAFLGVGGYVLATTTLPWLALAWPFAAAGVALAIGRTITRRRRLELDVAERTADLKRSEAYLAEGQRLTHAGSVAFAVPTWEVTHSSAEHTRLYGLDPDRGLPSLGEFSARLHPEDRSIPSEALQRGVRERRSVEAEFRVIVPDAGQRRLLATAQPIFDVSGRITEFVSTVVDVTERRQTESELHRLAGEQAALRRVATLVAGGASQTEVFEAVAGECAQLLDTEEMRLVRFEEGPRPSEVVVASLGKSAEHLPVGSRQGLVGENMTSRVFRTGRPARIDDYQSTASGPIGEALIAAGIRSIIGAPVTVEGRLWGAMGVASRHGVLPKGSEFRLSEFTELMATAIANSESRAREQRLAHEQAALRRVATLVAEDVEPSELFDAVAREVGALFGADFSGLVRFDQDAVIPVAAWAAAGEHPPTPPSWPRHAGDTATAIAETGRPVRVDNWFGLQGPIESFLRDELGVRSSVGAPVVVGRRRWGALGVHSRRPGALPPDTETRMAQFAHLVGTAIANAEARAEVARLALEQAALRRVATMVAREASQAEVFAEIAEGVGDLLGAEEIRMLRYEDERTALVVAASGETSDVMPVGSRQALGGENAASRVRRTRHPVRIDNYGTATGPIAEAMRRARIRGAVATPMLVEGRLWGTMVAGTTRDDPLPPETESRLSQFTELMATAIANTEARAEVERLADEQAALRRVATLVAHESPPAEVFAAVADEVARLLGVEDTTIFHYEDDWTATVVADRGERDAPMPIGRRVSLEGESATALVRRTGRSARIDDFSESTGPLAEYTRDAGIGSTVGSPIVVDGRLWGAMIAATRTDEAMPGDSESRMAQFTGLVATAISNLEARSDLAASRARIVEAADEERRRVVRDLHDGAQQRLVHAIVTLKLARRAFEGGDGNPESLVCEALQYAEHGNAELRELAHGILPAVLTHGGLRAALDTFVARLDLPVRVAVSDERLPPDIEASAYFVVAEALTNVVKHAHAGTAEVTASVDEGTLRLEIHDDGIGGADRNGSGLVGMEDRLTAVGGRLNVASPPGGGTRVTATVPLGAQPANGR